MKISKGTKSCVKLAEFSFKLGRNKPRFKGIKTGGYRQKGVKKLI
jgi:hypothetical protein